MSVVPIVEGIIDIIQKNIIAKSNVTSNITTGDIIIEVENSFSFMPQQEIVIIDYGYNDPTSPHYQKYEYAVVQSVNNTHWVTLTSPVIDNWTVANGSFIQKTIGHSPLYDDRVYYGDRDVIPTEEMAITVEPQSLSNEWLYIHGGLSEEYRVGIVIYGKDINTEEGMKILNKYTDAVYDLFNRNIHLDITDVDTPLLANVSAGANTVVIDRINPITGLDNLTYFIKSSGVAEAASYKIQDNLGTEIDLWVDSVTVDPMDNTKLNVVVYYNDPVQYGGVGSTNVLQRSYSIGEYAIFTRKGVYLYDSRIDNVEYGLVQKGSAFIRAARLNWFGKEITEYQFPQKSNGVDYFPQVTP